MMNMHSMCNVLGRSKAENLDQMTTCTVDTPSVLVTIGLLLR